MTQAERNDIINDFQQEYGLTYDDIKAIRPVAQMMKSDADGLTSMIREYFGINCHYEDVVELQKALR